MNEHFLKTQVFRKLAEAAQPVIQQNRTAYEHRLRSEGEDEPRICHLLAAYIDETRAWMEETAARVAKEALEQGRKP